MSLECNYLHGTSNKSQNVLILRLTVNCYECGYSLLNLSNTAVPIYCIVLPYICIILFMILAYIDYEVMNLG